MVKSVIYSASIFAVAIFWSTIAASQNPTQPEDLATALKHTAAIRSALSSQQAATEQDQANTVQDQAALAAVTGPGTAPDCTTVHVGPILPAPPENIVHTGGTCIFANNAQTVLDFQHDGNLVVYDLNPNTLIINRALFASNTRGTGQFFIFQRDGNLVIYRNDVNGVLENPVFSTHTFGHPNDHLSVQDDGNVVIYDSNCAVLFATHTNRFSNFPPGDGTCGK
ncbi:MAG TPA: hypothetical protein VKZ53_19490 [Candidatus Angelobacter sp.]|nr:hypothetical protein [Candidatus Angelobacter sp.]